MEESQNRVASKGRIPPEPFRWYLSSSEAMAAGATGADLASRRYGLANRRSLAEGSEGCGWLGCVNEIRSQAARMAQGQLIRVKGKGGR